MTTKTTALNEVKIWMFNGVMAFVGLMLWNTYTSLDSFKTEINTRLVKIEEKVSTASGEIDRLRAKPATSFPNEDTIRHIQSVAVLPDKTKIALK